jgi:hypothetical protein
MQAELARQGVVIRATSTILRWLRRAGLTRKKSLRLRWGGALPSAWASSSPVVEQAGSAVSETGAPGAVARRASGLHAALIG